MASTIEQLHREFGPRGLAVLAVNMGEERRTVAQWVADRRVSLPMLLDADDTVAAAARVTATPTAVLLDRGGRVVGKAVGSRPWLGDKGRALFAALLATGR